jgi:hypothetical protein
MDARLASVFLASFVDKLIERIGSEATQVERRPVSEVRYV